MDAKEKAKELVSKFKNNTRAFNETKGWQDSNYDAKQCALIALEEIFTNNTDESKHNFWIEVKQEIEKL